MNDILIIGHTGSIGSCLYYDFQKDHTVIGVSKDNGYDISTTTARNKILDLAESCKIIILNAFDPKSRHSQLDCLIDIYKKFEHEPKRIIVIGSCSQDKWHNRDDQYGEYQSHKAALDYATMNLNKKNNACKIYHIRLGLTATKTSYKPHRHKKCIKPESIAPMIRNLLAFPADMIPASITVLPDPEHGVYYDADR